MDRLKRIQFEDSEDVESTCPEITRGKEILYLTRAEIEGMGYNQKEIIELVRIALTEHGKKKVEMPAKIGIHPIKNAFHHAMPAFVPTAGASGIKWGGCFPENHKYCLAQTSALFILNDIQTGWPLAVMDASWITAKRTAAVSALAVEKLARQNSSELGILGCGVQGREHIIALASVMPNLKKVKVFDLISERTQRVINDFRGKYHFQIMGVSSYEELTKGSDVIVTATAILDVPDPRIKDEWIKEGALLLPIDFDSVFEWKTMTRADKFLVDSLDEMNYFMSIGYLASGLPPLYAEIGEVVAGIRAGRENEKELIFDMNIGMGVEDVIVAKDILLRAVKQNIGARLPL